MKDREGYFEPVFNIPWTQAKSTENLQCLSSFTTGWSRCLYSASRKKQIF